MTHRPSSPVPASGPSTDRAILRLAVPSIVSNITVPLLGLVDLAIVGHLQAPGGSGRYIAAIAVGTMIFNVMYWLFGFLRMGRQREEQGAEQGKQQSAGFRTDGMGVHCVVGRWIHTDGEVTSEGTDRSWKSSLTDFQDLPSPHGQVSLPALRRWYQNLKRRLKALIISPASLKTPAKFFRLK